MKVMILWSHYHWLTAQWFIFKWISTRLCCKDRRKAREISGLYYWEAKILPTCLHNWYKCYHMNSYYLWSVYHVLASSHFSSHNIALGIINPILWIRNRGLVRLNNVLSVKWYTSQSDSKIYALNQEPVLLKIPFTAEFLAYIHLCLQNCSLGPT